MALSLGHLQSRLLNPRSGCCMAGLVLKSGVTMDTHLVVDASGRHSRLPQWLSDEGFEVPPAETVNSKLGYATRMYHIPEWNKVRYLHMCTCFRTVVSKVRRKVNLLHKGKSLRVRSTSSQL